MNFDSPVFLQYHTYNSLFLSLPFRDIEETGTQLALFAKYCAKGLDADKPQSPVAIIEGFWEEYFDKSDSQKRISLLFYFIQYLERQVVLFDSVEEALFEKTHDINGAGSVSHLLLRLDNEASRQRLLQKLKDFQVRLVLTAHPTQFYPGKVLGIINDLSREIHRNDLAQIRLLLMQLGKTTFLNRQKPSPLDEAISLGWYLENVFYHTLPDILFRLLRALGQDPATFENPRLLALGFWPGGDRDGNPFVTAQTTLAVAERMRQSILRRYYADIRELKRRLTFRGTEDLIAAAEKKIYNTLYYPGQEGYASCQELLNDLLEARRILLDDHKGLFIDNLDYFILKIRVFGFYFSSIDIRQDSRKHAQVWEAIFQNWRAKYPDFDVDAYLKANEETKITQLLGAEFPVNEMDYSDPFVVETIQSFRVISTIQQANGELGCHRYIISNCSSALQVIEVLVLARLTASSPSSSVNIDVVPLFETIEDLADAGDAMENLYKNEQYARHLAARGNRQTIMLGFSDGTKDGGYLRANWSIYKAKEVLTRISRQYGISVIFFDGRGGPPGRGGGNNANFYASHGADIESREVHVTIQGQTVSSTYGTRPSARFNIERLLTAGLENHLFETHAREITDADRTLMDVLADTAYQAYLELKNHPSFVPYLENITPLKWYGETNIASRPTKRGTAANLKFEDLRAIPFVGAWAQMKQNVPGYYGFGAALADMKSKGQHAALQDLFRRSLFLRTLVENSMQSLSKSNFKVTRHLAVHAVFGPFWHMLYGEYMRTDQELRDLAQQKILLADNPASRTSIELREEIVLPLIVIQQFALQQLRDGKLPEPEAEKLRNLVLRAMFGIINAARNAA